MQDELTGLANRRRFEQALRTVMADGRAHVALLGLNGFKSVNDELGRRAGDRALCSLAQRLERAVPADALLARIGGDEFAVLLAGRSAAETGALAEELAARLREPVHAGGHDLLVGVGIGLATGERDEPTEVLRRAEAAMYAAKRAGQTYRCWEPAMDEQSTGHAKLGAEMQIGLDAGQFRVVYQPIVTLPERRIAAVEALVRWEHPQRGMVSPAQFVPVAEQNGLIVELGAWILRTACRQMARWRAELGDSAPGRVSVNVSARQLARPGFARTVADTLAETGLPPHCLFVEVTETAVFEGGQAVTTLHERRAGRRALSARLPTAAGLLLQPSRRRARFRPGTYPDRRRGGCRRRWSGAPPASRTRPPAERDLGRRLLARGLPVCERKGGISELTGSRCRGGRRRTPDGRGRWRPGVPATSRRGL
ncbi:putative bifunctional diguanylate cyclase/phosphodiesterase [Paractinoplanes toevensis]|nr:EAL domain-containing protein [Actinoplanes toevensis]